jgi:competence protein ComEA
VVPAVGDAPAAPGQATGGKVNLNTADAAALETLPRIGPAMAQRIIDWREQNGRFAAVEDLLDVTGIGDATFAGLKDLVTV